MVVSQSTATLDLLATLCALRGWSTARLDGSTDAARRGDIVAAFNSHGVGRVFLLSTTAGGAGLNLTGAARLLLFDSHWCVRVGRHDWGGRTGGTEGPPGDGEHACGWERTWHVPFF